MMLALVYFVLDVVVGMGRVVGSSKKPTIIINIVVLKRQNRLKVGSDKLKLKASMQSVSDDDVRKRLLEQSPVSYIHRFGEKRVYSILA